MTKQEFLDQESNTPETWATQQLLTTISKTKISQIRRVISELHHTLYKSTARNISLDKLLGILTLAEQLEKNETIETNGGNENQNT